MRTNRGTVAAAAAITAAASVVALGGPASQAASPGDADRLSGRSDFAAVGLTDDDRLVIFETRFPREIEVVGQITGLSGDTDVIGMDFRVQDDLLYAVGNSGGIYTVALSNAAATKVSQLTVGLTGDTFGVDFNPAADRLRVIGDDGQNLRHDLNADTTVSDGTLTYPAVPPDPPTTGMGITAAAYTNNDLDATTGTTLFDLDTMLDQTILQSPANAGALAATGKLGMDVGTDAGFDIYSKIKRGRSVGVSGFATLSVDGSYGLYKINLTSGYAKRLRTFPGGNQVVDLALYLDQR